MNTQKNIFSAKHALFFALFILLKANASAQVAPHYEVFIPDSIELQENTHILNSVIRITKKTPDDVRIGLSISFPKYWRSLTKFKSEDLASIELKQGDTKTIPFNLLDDSRILARWDTVIVKVWSLNTSDTAYYYSHIKVRPKTSFSIDHLDEYQKFTEKNPGAIRIRARIKNTGNTADEYLVKCSNVLFGVNKVVSIPLPPNTDTLVEFSFRPKSSKWKALHSETFTYKVSAFKSNTISTFLYTVARPSSELKQTQASFKSFPITIGGGLLVNGNKLLYFGHASGLLNMGDHTLNFNYRTVDFGSQANTTQRNSFYLSYRYKGLSLEGGRIQGPKNFLSTGQGVGIGYSSRRFRMTVSGLKHRENQTNPNFLNDNLYSSIRYKINKFTVDHYLESDFNEYYGVNNYLIYNQIALIHNKKTDLKIFGGAGIDESRENGFNANLGFVAGYDLVSYLGKWHVFSTIKYHSKDYPGMYNGSHMERHTIKYYFNTLYIGANFSLNSLRRNILRDTIYNSDFLSSNNSKLGISFGRKTAKSQFSIGAGQMQRTGGSTTTIENGKYVDGNINIGLRDNGKITFNMLNAFQQPENAGVLYSTNTALGIRTRHVGFTASYNRIPVFIEDNQTYMTVETVSGGPMVNFSFFGRKLTGNLRYTVSKSMAREALRNGFGGTINYSNKRNGLSVNISGFYPLRDPTNIDVPITETRYGSMLVSKEFNVPVKRYTLYDIKAVLFKDDNNNNILDGDEERLANAAVEIDDKTLTTNRKGEIAYRNMKPGVYQVNFTNSKHGDLIASNGSLQSIDLQEDTRIYVPFKKGKKLYGNVLIDRDSMSNSVLTADNFKVTVTDTSGRTYNAMTNRSGDFYVYLPEGVYNVSLNPEAFKVGDFKPVRMSYDIDMFTNEDSFVQFVIKQKKRAVRYLEQK